MVSSDLIQLDTHELFYPVFAIEYTTFNMSDLDVSPLDS